MTGDNDMGNDIDNNIEPVVIATMVVNKLRERTVAGDCTDCEGKGYTPLLGRCWTCMGTGNIPNKEKP